MKRIKNRAGFALPMAMLVLVVLTAGITAGYQSTSAEIVSNAAHRGDNKAYNIAEAGLEKYLATRTLTGLCATGSGMHSSTTTGGVTTVIADCIDDPTAATADSEWTTISMTGGYADVKAVMVRPYLNDTLPALYFIRSIGTDTSVRLTGISRSIAGSRGVGSYAEFGRTAVNVKGAWFALSGLTKNGAAKNCCCNRGNWRKSISSGAAWPVTSLRKRFSVC
jgi:Tfp pilus assembly protein PilV